MKIKYKYKVQKYFQLHFRKFTTLVGMGGWLGVRYLSIKGGREGGLIYMECLQYLIFVTSFAHAIFLNKKIFIWKRVMVVGWLDVEHLSIEGVTTNLTPKKYILQNRRNTCYRIRQIHKKCLRNTSSSSTPWRWLDDWTLNTSQSRGAATNWFSGGLTGLSHHHSRKKAGSRDPGSRTFFGPN